MPVEPPDPSDDEVIRAKRAIEALAAKEQAEIDARKRALELRALNRSDFGRWLGQASSMQALAAFVAAMLPVTTLVWSAYQKDRETEMTKAQQDRDKLIALQAPLCQRRLRQRSPRNQCTEGGEWT
jgi:hypothetical protein